ncbi:DUF3747 domain-containing protein [Waterburya agarophytonicola K14]|uniref:DUF3747 domain-containing protein n=1 Tax=Waterburya agarophytonicola KI4 TaxID=2874699 RepID=A0A964FFL2_9CYAN|nr:DUF3747 domain-containing protein [Waterburya agarophytonicola]MCC0177071.1 DUF3747 domain-containing protein [Waterburya agarophytonicola KI4]
MKLSLPIAFATITTMGMSAIAPMQPVHAVEFDEFAVDQSQFVAVAVPYNYRRYKLAIIEQVPGQKSCWSESGSRPTTVDLRLLTFDHTNDCLKAVDTNGYSLRVNGKDDKVEYTLNLVENRGQLELIADHKDPAKPNIVIGSTNGLVESPMKINLEPNWQFTKRLYEGGAIQHIYMSNNPSPQVLDNVATIPTTNLPGEAPGTSSNPTPQPLPPAGTVASQPAPPDVTTVEGFISNILTPLSQAVYNTYNSLFTTTTPPGSQSTPNK